MPKYKPLKKSRKNSSGRKSEAKRNPMTTKVKTNKKRGRPKTRPNYSYKKSNLNPSSPKQLPETELTKKGVTLRNLFKNTPLLFRQNAKEVVIHNLKRVATRSGLPAVSCNCSSTDRFRPNKIQRNHKVVIIGNETDADGNISTKSVNKHRKVIVSCGCENFTFVWEYANAIHGASRIIYSNGEPPVVTNPKLSYGLCKHLIAVASYIIKKDI